MADSHPCTKCGGLAILEPVVDQVFGFVSSQYRCLNCGHTKGVSAIIPIAKTACGPRDRVFARRI